MESHMLSPTTLPNHTPRPHSNLGVGLNNYEPAWLLGHGFNMNDVNFSIFSAISDFGQRNFAQPPPPDHDQVYAAADALSVLNASPTLVTARGRQEHQQQQNQPQQSASIVQHKWHTQLSPSLPVHMPSAPLSDPEQWENYMGRDKRETSSLMQAALIGQTFGLLSGRPQDLCMVEAFAGTVISWARQGGFSKIKNSLEVVGLNQIGNSSS
ncbi:hypothetical protein ACKRZS_003706 [Fusarium odoratissimum]